MAAHRPAGCWAAAAGSAEARGERTVVARVGAVVEELLETAKAAVEMVKGSAETEVSVVVVSSVASTSTHNSSHLSTR